MSALRPSGATVSDGHAIIPIVVVAALAPFFRGVWKMTEVLPGHGRQGSDTGVAPVML